MSNLQKQSESITLLLELKLKSVCCSGIYDLVKLKVEVDVSWTHWLLTYEFIALLLDSSAPFLSIHKQLKRLISPTGSASKRLNAREQAKANVSHSSL